MRLLIIVLFVSVQTACSNELKKTITGNWGVKEIYYQNEYYGANLLSNIISFKENGECGFPVISIDQENKGSWSVLEKDSICKLNLNIPENPFEGEYWLYFEKDHEEKLLIMVLKNEVTEIRAAKMMYDFDKEQSKKNR